MIDHVLERSLHIGIRHDDTRTDITIIGCRHVHRKGHSSGETAHPLSTQSSIDLSSLHFAFRIDISLMIAPISDLSIQAPCTRGTSPSVKSSEIGIYKIILIHRKFTDNRIILGRGLANDVFITTTSDKNKVSI